MGFFTRARQRLGLAIAGIPSPIPLSLTAPAEQHAPAVVILCGVEGCPNQARPYRTHDGKWRCPACKAQGL